MLCSQVIIMQCGSRSISILSHPIDTLPHAYWVRCTERGLASCCTVNKELNTVRDCLVSSYFMSLWLCCTDTSITNRAQSCHWKVKQVCIIGLRYASWIYHCQRLVPRLLPSIQGEPKSVYTLPLFCITLQFIFMLFSWNWLGWEFTDHSISESYFRTYWALHFF